MNLSVKPIHQSFIRSAGEEFIIDIHYAGRWPSISYAYGLFDEDDNIIGIITYGTPSSSALKVGIAGKDNKDKVLELNRLCLKHNRKNEASFLIAKSLKMLPHGKIIISFADTSQDHNGCVYRASNFTYHGLSAIRKDYKIRGREHLHSQTICDEFRGEANRMTLMREKYGDDLYTEQRPRKHRYIFITGTKRDKKSLRKQLLYPEVKFEKQQ